MSTALETLKQWALTFANLPMIAQVAAGLLCLSITLRLVPQFPNAWVFPAVAVVGSALGFFIVPMQRPGDWGFEVAYPIAADAIRRIAVGLTAAVIVCTFQRLALRRLEKRAEEALRRWIGAGDTTTIEKEDR